MRKSPPGDFEKSVYNSMNDLNKQAAVYSDVLYIVPFILGKPNPFLTRDIPGTIDCFCDLDMCYIINFRTYDDIDVPV